jgi:SpoVK/Ycf46/Vps4 family AAA+-type ATPase
MRRPGRFDEIIEFSNPSLEQRDAILDVYLKEFEVELTPEERRNLAEAAGGMTGAYLQEVAKRSKVVPLQTLLDEVEQMKRICGLEDEDEDDDEDDDGDTPESVRTSSDADEVVQTLAKALKAIVDGGRNKPKGWYTTRMRRARAKDEADENPGR